METVKTIIVFSIFVVAFLLLGIAILFVAIPIFVMLINLLN